jgi:hypothetical protein
MERLLARLGWCFRAWAGLRRRARVCFGGQRGSQAVQSAGGLCERAGVRVERRAGLALADCATDGAAMPPQVVAGGMQRRRDAETQRCRRAADESAER